MQYIFYCFAIENIHKIMLLQNLPLAAFGGIGFPAELKRDPAAFRREIPLVANACDVAALRVDFANAKSGFK
jgi:hypothetical protein